MYLEHLYQQLQCMVAGGPKQRLVFGQCHAHLGVLGGADIERPLAVSSYIT